MWESKLLVFPTWLLVIAVDRQERGIELPLTTIDDRRWIIGDIHLRKIDSSVIQHAVFILVVVGETLHFGGFGVCAAEVIRAGVVHPVIIIVRLKWKQNE
jgi:hypothetical protein